MRDSDTVRKRILDKAAILFDEHGFDGTSLAKVSKASGSSVGSVTHFFGKKPQLASAVCKHVVEDVLVAAKAALDQHRSDVPKAIRALLSVTLSWAEKNPHHRRLIRMLAAFSTKSEQVPNDGLEELMAPILANWAAQLIITGAIAPLTPSQLYAIAMAPAMCATASTDSQASQHHRGSVDWLETLTAAALAAISPPGQKQGLMPKRVSGLKKKSPDGAPAEIEQADLLGLPVARRRPGPGSSA